MSSRAPSALPAPEPEGAAGADYAHAVIGERDPIDQTLYASNASGASDAAVFREGVVDVFYLVEATSIGAKTRGLSLVEPKWTSATTTTTTTTTTTGTPLTHLKSPSMHLELPPTIMIAFFENEQRESGSTEFSHVYLYRRWRFTDDKSRNNMMLLPDIPSLDRVYEWVPPTVVGCLRLHFFLFLFLVEKMEI